MVHLLSLCAFAVTLIICGYYLTNFYHAIISPTVDQRLYYVNVEMLTGAVLFNFRTVQFCFEFLWLLTAVLASDSCTGYLQLYFKAVY